MESFLTALRAADFDGFLAVLDPDVVVRLDSFGAAPDAPRELHGARTWAKGASAFAHAARFAQPALVDGEVGVVVAPHGRLFRVLRLTVAHARITQVEVIADPARLRALNLAVAGS